MKESRIKKMELKMNGHNYGNNEVSIAKSKTQKINFRKNTELKK